MAKVLEVEFEYNKELYIFNSESGWIEKPGKSLIYSEKICPVGGYDSLEDSLTTVLLTLSTEQIRIILRSILHSYLYGHDAGEKAKASELKRALFIQEF